ncbi:wax ester/triacylglycerol synthase family O-acyltransferase [Mycolicibacterium sp.]|uniref:wax ester/triacylglycerol synthase family O-acyltransferase n=2 Tax=Mycolicibacterium sp. TaxID=2320850 RepID=UPI003D125D77
MDRLTAFDAGFLEAEDADRHASLAVGAISVLEGPAPAFDDIVAAFSDRILQVPRLRQVVRRQPFDLSAPEWVEDPHLDLAHHIHRAALPHPGDDETLFRFAAEAMEPRLDRDRPLWQCWVIEGLAGNRWAMLMKVHHCIADGIATMRMLTGLSDSGGGETYVDAVRATRNGDGPRREPSGPTLNPLTWARAMWTTASAVTATAAVTVEGTVEIVDGLIRGGRQSSLHGPVTAMRRYSAVTVPLADVMAVRRAFDVTLNDVALAAVTDSFRATLRRRGEEPAPDTLRTLVPVSVRSDDAMDRVDNRVSVMLPYLPVDVPDRVEQLRIVHERLTRVKASGQRQAASTAVGAVKLVPFALASRVIRALTSLPQRGVATLTTNVPGPQRRLQLMGRDVVRMFPIPPMALRMRTAVAILSYGQDVVFGITTDFDAFPDIDELTAGIAEAVSSLAAAAAAGRGASEGGTPA